MRRGTRSSHRAARSGKSDREVSALANQIDDQIRRSAGALRNLIQTYIPQGAVNEVSMALAYAEGDCDLTSDICRTKRDFFSDGFRMVAKIPGATSEGSSKSGFDELNTAINGMVAMHKLPTIAEELTFFFAACDNAILHCKIEGGAIDYVQTIDPRDVDWSKTTTSQLALRIPSSLASEIKTELKTTGGRQKLLERYPEKYIQAAENGSNLVILINDDGEYWWHAVAGNRWTGLCRPSHRQIVPDVILRQIFIDGDWSAAYFLKNIIQHVKAGEAGPSNQVTMGKRGPTWASTEDLKKLNNQLKELNKALRLMTDHTVKIEYIYPPKEAWDPTKYLKVEDRILRWGGVPEQLLTGKGDGHAQGQTGFTRFAANGKFVRRRIGDLFVDMFTHPDLRNAWGLPDQATVQAIWSQQNLKSPKVALDETNAAYDRGMLDDETYHERIGEDHDIVKARMQKQPKKFWQPAFEKSQGLLTQDGEGGRPDEGEGTSENDGPRPSRGE